jgi:hypothetical protein
MLGLVIFLDCKYIAFSLPAKEISGYFFASDFFNVYTLQISRNKLQINSPALTPLTLIYCTTAGRMPFCLPRLAFGLVSLPLIKPECQFVKIDKKTKKCHRKKPLFDAQPPFAFKKGQKNGGCKNAFCVFAMVNCKLLITNCMFSRHFDCIM